MVQQDTRPGMPQEPADAAAVEQTEQIVESGDTTAPVRTISEHRSVTYDGAQPRNTLVEAYPPPPPVMLEPDPRRYWGLGPGIGTILAILLAVIGVAIVIFLLVARGNQAAPATSLAPIPTSEAVQQPAAPAPAAVAPAPAVPTAPPAQAPLPQPVAPQPVAPALAPPPAAIAPAPATAPAGTSAATADTPAGTILVPGDTWRQNGLELTLTSPQISANGGTADFSLTNRGQSDIRFQFTKGSAFSAVDNRNAPLKIGDPNYRYDFVLQPNATMLLDGSHAGGAISFAGPLSSPQLSSIMVTVKGMADISNAQWRIPFQH